MIDFSVPPEIAELRKGVSDFMDRHVYPAEREMSDEGEGLPLERLRAIQAQAKAHGLWAPHMPVEVGGMGIGVVGLALLNEVIGRSPIGPISLGCQAPDAGNCEILHLYGTEAQKRTLATPQRGGGDPLVLLHDRARGAPAPIRPASAPPPCSTATTG